MKYWFLSLLALLLIGCATQYRVTKKIDPVSHMTGFDYNLNVTPINGTVGKLADFKGKKMSIFYLSPKCPHCKTALSKIGKTREFLDSLGYARVNICIKFATEEEFTKFIKDGDLAGFNFKDSEREFSHSYGIGSVPLFFVVNDSGDVSRYNIVGDSLPDQVRSQFEDCCKD